MGTFGAEDHEVGDVDDAYAECGDEFAEEGGCGDDFEGDFYADADEDAGRESQTGIANQRWLVTYTSGSTPPSVLANFQIEAPAMQCCKRL